MTRGRLALVDGTLWPCWSWESAPNAMYFSVIGRSDRDGAARRRSLVC